LIDRSATYLQDENKERKMMNEQKMTAEIDPANRLQSTLLISRHAGNEEHPKPHHSAGDRLPGY
jgi:hypothetical protein